MYIIYIALRSPQILESASSKLHFKGKRPENKENIADKLFHLKVLGNLSIIVSTCLLIAKVIKNCFEINCFARLRGGMNIFEL